MNTDLELKRKRIETFAKIGGLGLIGFIAAPFIFIAIKGLIGLLVAATVGFAAIQFTPYIAAKIANWRLQAIKHEASKNPIETLQNDYQKRASALSEFRSSISNFRAEISNFADKLNGFIKQYPSEADKFKSQLNKMKQLLGLREEKYKDAHQNLNNYELEIKKADAIWQMGQAAAVMSKAAGMTEEDFLAKIQVETALDSVQKNLNLAFADLETSLLDEDTQSDSQTRNLVNEEVCPPKINQKVKIA